VATLAGQSEKIDHFRRRPDGSARAEWHVISILARLHMNCGKRQPVSFLDPTVVAIARLQGEKFGPC
jgi:hypothetical protein